MLGETAVFIDVPDEGFALAGALLGPAGGAPLVVCHPHPAFGGTMDAPLVVALARGAAAAGMRVLRFDFRGVRQSGGKATGGEAEQRDVAAAVGWLGAEAAGVGRSDGGVALAGYSFGALMAVRAVAAGLRASRLALVAIPTGVVSGHAAREADVRTTLAAQPTLLITGDRDTFCDVATARAWVDASSGTGPGVPPRLAVLPGVDHFPVGEGRADLVAQTVEFLVAG